MSRGVRGVVWIGFEVKNYPIQNKNHAVWFDLNDYSTKI